MNIKFVFLYTDILLFLLIIGAVIFFITASKRETFRLACFRVKENKFAMISLFILFIYMFIGLLDSFHFQQRLSTGKNGSVIYSTQVISVLDYGLSSLRLSREETYSAPFALHSYSKQNIKLQNGEYARTYPRLSYPPESIKTEYDKWRDIFYLSLIGLFIAALFSGLILFIYWRISGSFQALPWIYIVTLITIITIISLLFTYSQHYHVLGTDKIGIDTFYQSLKSIRTGLVIGLVTTVVMMPFALLLGIAAGYFGGFLDDVIQYLYTTLSSIPGVLLIAASILSIQVYITNHPDQFKTIIERSDARLVALCLILGITSWTSLCRLLRAETLKIRDLDYVRAAIVLGVRSFKIMLKHILPNVMHIIVISLVLDFSSLVLAEAVLSYVGVGVDPATQSWGNMINSARLELARYPVVWWPLFSAFSFMFILVIAVNLLSDAVQEAFDPRRYNRR